MIPTARVYGLLAIGGAVSLVVSGISDANSQGLLASLILLTFDGTVLAMMVIDGWRVKSRRIQLTRQPLQRLSIGRNNPVTLTLKTSQWPTTLQIYDQYPADFGGGSMPLRVNLPANSTQALTYTVHPKRRGEFQFRNVRLRQRSPWGLAWHGWTVAQGQIVAVYPDLISLRSLAIKLAIQSTGSIREKQRLGIGTEFAELRDYGAGDDPRLIDWKATARRSHLLVRVLEPEREQTLIILLDRGRLMTARVKGLSRFDWGLNSTLSLALAGIQRGDRVGIGVFDHKIHTWVPPARGQQHLQHLIEKLTSIQPVLLESDYLGAVTTLTTQQQRRALVVVITDIVDSTASAELLSALIRLRPRYLPFCVTLRDPQVDQQAHTFAPQVAQAYTRAVALDLLAQRQIAFTRLKQSGVLVLDAPVDQITEPLVEEYLRIKRRNQL